MNQEEVDLNRQVPLMEVVAYKSTLIQSLFWLGYWLLVWVLAALSQAQLQVDKEILQVSNSWIWQFQTLIFVGNTVQVPLLLT